MKKTILFLMIFALVIASQAMALDKKVFRSTLIKFDKVAIPMSAMVTKGSGADSLVTKKGGNSNNHGDFPYLTAAKVNKKIELLIRGIEDVKGIATALAIITDLYQNGQISVDVAITAIDILKLRAVYLKIFVSNGNSDIEVMINILEDNKNQLAKQKSAQVNVEVTGQTNIEPCDPSNQSGPKKN